MYHEIRNVYMLDFVLVKWICLKRDILSTPITPEL